jgi:ankyrin repeat protein
LPEPVRVWCQGAWHQVAVRDGRLDALAHTSAEAERESVVSALGGELSGCFAVQRAWRDGRRLPKKLRAQRRVLFDRALAGDTHGVLVLLDAGWDPAVREGDSGKTLLHLLADLDHELLLDRLLTAGLDVNALDHRGRGALQAAVCGGGSPALVRALADAGADLTPFMRDLFQWLEVRRYDLDFLVERIDDALTAGALA